MSTKGGGSTTPKQTPNKNNSVRRSLSKDESQSTIKRSILKDEGPSKMVVGSDNKKSVKKKAGEALDTNEEQQQPIKGKVKITKPNPKDKEKDNKKKKSKKVEKVKQPSFRAKTQPKNIFQKIFNIGPDVIIYDPRALEAVDALHLTQSHLQTLRKRFDSIDIDGSGSIDIDEFLESIGEQRSPFTDRIFKTIDIDGSGSIEFDEFIRILATYCMYTKDDILRFCFECFDKDGSNAIDENEFMQLCK